MYGVFQGFDIKIVQGCTVMYSSGSTVLASSTISSISTIGAEAPDTNIT